jgi:hypothetical protein
VVQVAHARFGAGEAFALGGLRKAVKKVTTDATRATYKAIVPPAVKPPTATWDGAHVVDGAGYGWSGASGYRLLTEPRDRQPNNLSRQMATMLGIGIETGTKAAAVHMHVKWDDV